MTLDFARARPLLQSGDLARLFREELGWEPSRQKLTLRAAEQDHALTAFAEKRGFTAWLCVAPDGGLPAHATRLKIERKLTETNFEHLIVFTTPDRDRQSWMWVRREPGKPLAVRTHEFFRAQAGDSLLQKLDSLYVSFAEEEAGIAVVQMGGKARAAFDLERVTKAFYRDFDTYRKAFLTFIDGIGEVADREWYASVMLNRLMFVYFIQKKGFLDGDRDYLRHRLERSQQEKGKDKFYTFYRYFLLRLFHEGFGRRRQDRAPDLEKLLGNIPYLNGGLFDVHELEKPERYGEAIQISDKAFERVFDYFDAYQWHLDERPLRNDKEINPDVLGYIFEKYINQKQMGAYYTKEDITDYIGKNTILPFLFDAARARCKVAFENPDGPTVWDLLRENPDRYIYPAVRHGTDKKLPADIAAGLDTTKPNLIERRQTWNKPAPADYALPTEIWREVVARRQRCEEVRRKLAAGEVRAVNDFITLNLDLRQFAQDVIQSCEGPDLLMALWHAITTITVLDPTGGSGAFVFAALNILDPLYEACLDRMEAFLAEWGEHGKKAHPNYHKKFTEVLARVDAHPNRRYFVLKSIILNNLYAVDIMEEAVEICKLRLFLKLAAQVEPDATKDNLGIEPLPDVDFNIRAGNTLVGYATYDEVKRAVTGTLDFDDAMGKIAVKAADLQQTFDKFRQLQTEGDGSVPAAHKLELQKRLKALEDELNRHLAGEYGVKVSDKAAYAKWVKSHQPFHWFIQFYGILNGGGFDVIIGNPPYVEYTKKDKITKLSIRDIYLIRDYKTLTTNNLYAFTMERTLLLQSPRSWSGMIVPVSFVSGDSYAPLVGVTCTKEMWLSSFSNRPAKLFDGVEQRLTIYIRRNLGSTLHSAPYSHWYSDERDHLFDRLAYMETLRFGPSLLPLKIGRAVERCVIDKIICHRANVTRLEGRGSNGVWFHDGPTYWIRALPFEPNKGIKSVRSNHYHCISAANKDAAAIICALLNSSTFYFFFKAISNCRDFGGKELYLFSLPDSLLSLPADLVSLSKRLGQNLKATAHRASRLYDSGEVHYEEYYPQQSKPILDEIDTVLAGHYGFTAEELDFILNYDIKYRLGRDTTEDGE